MPVLDLTIPHPQPGDLASATDILGQVFGPGDIVAVALTSGRSACMDISLVKRITTTDAKGKRLPPGDGEFKLVVRTFGSSFTRSGELSSSSPNEKDSTLLCGRFVVIRGWDLDMLLGKLYPNGIQPHQERIYADAEYPRYRGEKNYDQFETVYEPYEVLR